MMILLLGLWVGRNAARRRVFAAAQQRRRINQALAHLHGAHWHWVPQAHAAWAAAVCWQPHLHVLAQAPHWQVAQLQFGWVG
jgi:hypothetical protein